MKTEEQREEMKETAADSQMQEEKACQGEEESQAEVSPVRCLSDIGQMSVRSNPVPAGSSSDPG